MRVLTHVIDVAGNDQYQCVIDVLSLFMLLMLSIDGATGLPENLCIYTCVMHVCECSGAYLDLIFILNRDGVCVTPNVGVCEMCLVE